MENKLFELFSPWKKRASKQNRLRTLFSRANSIHILSAEQAQTWTQRSFSTTSASFWSPCIGQCFHSNAMTTWLATSRRSVRTGTPTSRGSTSSPACWALFTSAFCSWSIMIWIGLNNWFGSTWPTLRVSPGGCIWNWHWPWSVCSSSMECSIRCENGGMRQWTRWSRWPLADGRGSMWFCSTGNGTRSRWRGLSGECIEYSIFSAIQQASTRENVVKLQALELDSWFPLYSSNNLHYSRSKSLRLFELGQWKVFARKTPILRDSIRILLALLDHFLVHHQHEHFVRLPSQSLLHLHPDSSGEMHADDTKKPLSDHQPCSHRTCQHSNLVVLSAFQ